MDPSLGVGLLALLGVIVTAVSNHLRGNKADQAVQTTELLKSNQDTIRISQHGLLALVEQLRTEVGRYQKATAECEAECREVREENVALIDQVASTRAALRAHEQATQEMQLEIRKLQNRIHELEAT